MENKIERNVNTPEQRLSQSPQNIFSDGENRQLRIAEIDGAVYWGIYKINEGEITLGEMGVFLGKNNTERSIRQRISITGCNQRLL